MNAHPTYPRVKSVEALPDYQLLVSFRNGERRLYDFKPNLDLEIFQLLRNEVFFRAVKADSHGYGIIWNDDMDLAESELWLKGKPLEHAVSSTAPELLTA